MQQLFLCVLIATVQVEVVRIDKKVFVKSLARIIDTRLNRIPRTYFIPDSNLALRNRKKYERRSPRRDVKRTVFLDLENSVNDDDSEYGMDIDMGPLLNPPPKMVDYQIKDKLDDLYDEITSSNLKSWKNIEDNESDKHEYDGIVSDTSEDEYINKYKHPNVHWRDSHTHRNTHHGKYDLGKIQRHHGGPKQHNPSGGDKSIKHINWISNHSYQPDQQNGILNEKFFGKNDSLHRIEINTNKDFQITDTSEFEEVWMPKYKSHKVHKKPTGFNPNLGKRNKLKYHVLTYADFPESYKLKPIRRTTPKAETTSHSSVKWKPIEPILKHIRKKVKPIHRTPAPKEHKGKLQPIRPPLHYVKPTERKGFKQNVYIGGPLGIWGQIGSRKTLEPIKTYIDIQDWWQHMKGSEHTAIADFPKSIRRTGKWFEPRTERINPLHDNISVFDNLFDIVRILCIVMTHPGNHKSRARQVKNTWGKRCNKLLFISSVKDESLPTIVLTDKEGQHLLWNKTRAAFKHVYYYYVNEVDWFLKADDETYMIMENLRYLLLKYNTHSPLYFGCKVHLDQSKIYMHGGAGYVLSKEALTRLVVQGLHNPAICDQGEFGSVEDVFIGQCLQHLHVDFVEPKDSKNRSYFLPQNIIDTLQPTLEKKYWQETYLHHPKKEGLDCCSDRTISFHSMSPEDMLVAEFLIYHVRPQGVYYNKYEVNRLMASEHLPILGDHKPELDLSSVARRIDTNMAHDKISHSNTKMDDESDISDYEDIKIKRKAKPEYNLADVLHTKGTKWYKNKYFNNTDPTDTDKSELSEFFRESSEENSDSDEIKIKQAEEYRNYQKSQSNHKKHYSENAIKDKYNTGHLAKSYSESERDSESESEESEKEDVREGKLSKVEKGSIKAKKLICKIVTRKTYHIITTTPKYPTYLPHPEDVDDVVKIVDNIEKFNLKFY